MGMEFVFPTDEKGNGHWRWINITKNFESHLNESETAAAMEGSLGVHWISPIESGILFSSDSEGIYSTLQY